MKPQTETLASEHLPKSEQSELIVQPQCGILSERAAIVICTLSVAIFAIPILVVIQVVSGLYQGGSTVYQLLNDSSLDMTDEL